MGRAWLRHSSLFLGNSKWIFLPFSCFSSTPISSLSFHQKSAWVWPRLNFCLVKLTPRFWLGGKHSWEYHELIFGLVVQLWVASSSASCFGLDQTLAVFFTHLLGSTQLSDPPNSELSQHDPDKVFEAIYFIQQVSWAMHQFSPCSWTTIVPVKPLGLSEG